MKTVLQEIANDPASLIIGNLPLPVPAPGSREILIRVYCAALNRLDLLQSAGSYPVPAGASPVLGIEVSGSIVAMGDRCTSDLKVNDQIMGLVPGGGYSEFCIADERTIMHAIPGVPPDVLAAIPEAFLTAYQLCFKLANVQPGEAVLLHAAASSVGQAAIQMLTLKGARVYCTVRSEAKRQRCLELGAVAATLIDFPTDLSFSEWAIAANDGKPIDVVLDPVGSAYFQENVVSLGIDGRLILYGLMGGAAVEDPMLLNKLLAKRLSVIATTLRSRTDDYKKDLIEALKSDPVGIPAIASGAIKVTVDRTYELDQVLEAHDYMRRNKNIGKIILSVTSTASAIEFFQRELQSLDERNHINIDAEQMSK
ncbi:hypothetical protein B484DRAFT_443402 [Ochromonadaceae sp. CCMP2298]|nr:hypothetical protein B484DRAFT_443402 [Ochromonadaceae sp. CCMP2298]|mmetsp:Transcript_16532/g.36645  ORF Transcript_16532/g.36645 Transcript_16532/m.36645 type:complete len:368 (+) Transcript_16532:148-1251(+)